MKLFAGKNNSVGTRRYIRLATMALDRIVIEVAIKDREITSLREKVTQANPPKRRKVTIKSK